ncbi:hypothetical protein [Synechococcus sp. Cu2B8-bc1011]|uniref:hypothetical protein n=1 Tax=Synechococcus sp. Cu2B8-bc1011 TaxID=3093725 RepID=UPI0039AFF84F
MTFVQLPSHQPVCLFYNQQRLPLLGLDLTTYIASKLFNSQYQPRLVAIAERAVKAHPPNGLKTYAQLPSHKHLSLLFNQQRHHPIRPDFTSTSFQAVQCPPLKPSALLARSSISSSCSKASVI